MCGQGGLGTWQNSTFAPQNRNSPVKAQRGQKSSRPPPWRCSRIGCSVLKREAIFRKKLVASRSVVSAFISEQRRRSVTFCGEEEQGSDAPGGFLCRRQKKTSEQSGLCSDVVEVTGLEPAASWSQTTRATNCATPRCGAWGQARCSLYYTQGGGALSTGV